MPKTALIMRITGRDRTYLDELLIGKGYFLHRVIRRASKLNADRIDDLYQALTLASVVKA